LISVHITGRARGMIYLKGSVEINPDNRRFTVPEALIKNVDYDHSG
jgi:hypothetical protein